MTSVHDKQLSNSGDGKNIPAINIQPGFDQALRRLQEMKNNPAESNSIIIKECFGSWREWD